MLHSENNRFPNSSELFAVCKEVLNIKHARGEKVTDQDVGALLEFDPADCTHWKYGRKNIKSVQSFCQLGEKLEIDQRVLVDVVQGRTSSLDVLNDYRGYGSFEVAPQVRSHLLEEAMRLVSVAESKGLPIFLPELAETFRGCVLEAREGQDDLIQEQQEGDVWVISWKKSAKMCGSLRFLLAQRLSRFYLTSYFNQFPSTHQPNVAECNLFSLFLLMPTHLLQVASCQSDPKWDLVDQLARHFWLTRSLVNIRVKDFFAYKN